MSTGDPDWYKITTASDGKLTFTVIKNAQGTASSIFFTLYDNDGVTSLGGGKIGTMALSPPPVDGLASGTYYVKVTGNGDEHPTISYEISVKLTSTQANDNEPDNNYASAQLLPLNGNSVGHIGYYYNLQRDTADWFKVTTNAKGLLRVIVTPDNENVIRTDLFNTNGITLLDSAVSPVLSVVSRDKLPAGTYYIKITSASSNQFETYSLNDSLIKGEYANDAEPNNKPILPELLLPTALIPGILVCIIITSVIRLTGLRFLFEAY